MTFRPEQIRPQALDHSHVEGHGFPWALKTEVERVNDLATAFGAAREPRQFRAAVALRERLCEDRVHGA